MSTTSTIQLDEHCELAGIAFVRDYTEFHFDGPVLRALVDPIVLLSNRTVASTDSGWRDALCSLIGKEIAKVQISDGEVCELRFVTGEAVKINLSTREAESLHFVPGPNKPIEVW